MLHPDLRNAFEKLGSTITPREDGSTDVHVHGATQKFNFAPDYRVTSKMLNDIHPVNEYGITWANHLLNEGTNGIPNDEFDHKAYIYNILRPTTYGYKTYTHPAANVELSVHQSLHPDDPTKKVHVVHTMNPKNHNEYAAIQHGQTSAGKPISETGQQLIRESMNNLGAMDALMDHLMENHPEMFHFLKENNARVYSKIYSRY